MAILKLKNKTTGEWEEIQAIKGNGIDRIEKTATVGNKDTYTIYFTNGSTTTYEVSNGEVTREELEEEVERLSMIYNAFPSTTGEVEEGSINGTAEVPFKEIGLKGNTSQDGTPTPISPIPVNVVSGNNKINIIGKNFLENQYLPIPSADINADYTVKNAYLSKGTYTLATTDNSTFGNTIYIKLFKEDKQVIKENGHLSTPNGDYSTGTYNYFIGTANNLTYIQFTIDDNYYARIGLLNSNNTKEVMLVKGTEIVRTYEPYQSNTYPINLGSMELCKIGDYQDYLYKENGIWYKYGAIGKVVLDGSENWIYNSGNSVFVCNNLVNYSLQNFAPYCNNYKGINIVLAYNQLNNNEISFLKDSSNNRTLIKDTRYTIASDLRTWLSTHNTTLYYVLNTPTITPITDTTLIEQLDNLERAYSYDTQTNISQTNQDKPFIISYEAILSLRNVLNKPEDKEQTEPIEENNAPIEE